MMEAIACVPPPVRAWLQMLRWYPAVDPRPGSAKTPAGLTTEEMKILQVIRAPISTNVARWKSDAMRSMWRRQLIAVKNVQLTNGRGNIAHVCRKPTP